MYIKNIFKRKLKIYQWHVIILKFIDDDNVDTS